MPYPRIKELREDHDYTQQKVADYLHISRSAYSNYENGARNVPVDVLAKLAKFYQTTVDYLIGLSGEIKR